VIAPATARRLWESLEPLHASVYFAPEPAEAFAQLGLKGFWMGYVASRAAPMGPVTPAVVEATFAGFHPSLIRRALPDAWDLASPEEIIATRFASASLALQRLLGGPPSSGEVEIVGDLLLDALGRADPVGRPIFAAHLALDRPEDPTARVWHAATVFREHRGDGHVAALTAEGVNGCASHVLAVGRGVTDRTTQQGARRWSDEEWADAVEGLRRRRLVNEDESLTQHGQDLVVHIEAVTDRRSAEALDSLGDGAEAVLSAVEPMARRAIAAGAVPFPNPMGYAHPSWV
jgi:hypothetical protein